MTKTIKFFLILFFVPLMQFNFFANAKFVEEIIVTSSKENTQILKVGGNISSTNSDEIKEVIQILKSDDKFRFRQLIDIAGVDYPADKNRFNLVYLLLSHEKNIRIKIDKRLIRKKDIPVFIGDNAKLMGLLKDFEFIPWSSSLKKLIEVNSKKI